MELFRYVPEKPKWLIHLTGHKVLTFLSTLKTHNWKEEVDIGHVVLSRSLPRTGEPGGCSYSELWGFWHKLHTEPFLFFLWHLLLLLCVLAGELHLYLLSQPSQKSQDSSFSLPFPLFLHLVSDQTLSVLSLMLLISLHFFLPPLFVVELRPLSSLVWALLSLPTSNP